MEHLFLWTIASVGGMSPLWKNSALHNTLFFFNFTFLWPIPKVSMVSICSAITPLLSIKTPFRGSGFSLSRLHSSVWNNFTVIILQKYWEVCALAGQEQDGNMWAWLTTLRVFISCGWRRKITFPAAASGPNFFFYPIFVYYVSLAL